MATKKSQRIAIWVIAVVMLVGTVGSFFVIILQNDNAKIDQEQQAKMMADYQAQMKKAQDERQKTLKPLDGYVAEAFDGSTVTELKSEVLVEGSGAELKSDSGMTINYFGWTADGKIFDSTNINGTTTPTDQLKLNGVIPGWTEGLTGKKAGSTVKLTIPADKAYGSVDKGDGSPIGPLTFIVEVKEVK
jgi:FKBP-type peptidyl-prolyl cis-trans isomerase FkpA